jgi:hypothetical protein
MNKDDQIENLIIGDIPQLMNYMTLDQISFHSCDHFNDIFQLEGGYKSVQRVFINELGSFKTNLGCVEILKEMCPTLDIIYINGSYSLNQIVSSFLTKKTG